MGASYHSRLTAPNGALACGNARSSDAPRRLGRWDVGVGVGVGVGVALVLTGFALNLIGAIRYVSVFREWMKLVFSSSEVSPEQAGEVFSRLLNAILPFVITGMAAILAGITCIVTGLLMRRRAREAMR